jgi:hypothetical protein
MIFGRYIEPAAAAPAPAQAIGPVAATPVPASQPAIVERIKTSPAAQG